jgi:hypothetical protein
MGTLGRAGLDQRFGGGFNSTLPEGNPAPMAPAQAVNP